MFLIALAAVGTATTPTYTPYIGKNCYNGYGGVEIDSDSSAPTGKTVASCEAYCDADQQCDCVTFQASIGKCWRRASCEPSQFQSSSTYSTYVKAVPTPTGPPGTYTQYENRNAYSGHGASELGPSGGVLTINKLGVPDVTLCEARCDANAKCDCVTFQPQYGRCWTRTNCVASQFQYNGDYQVYVKNPSPQPNPPPSPGPSGGPGRVGSFIVIGDWGYDTREHCNPNSGCGMTPQCQQNIANKMKQWVAANPDVKFVINVGDNFYATGVSSPDAERWTDTWKNVYGDTITNLKWYSVYGNHDYEGSDACACTDPATDQSACAQLNGMAGNYHKNLNGWYMPNLYYHDTSMLEEYGIEIVGLDTNSVAESACKYLGKCQSKGQQTCWNNLNGRYRSSMDLFAERMKGTVADNVLVFNHYPSTYFTHSGRESFLEGLRTGPANGADLYYFGGHVHFVKEQGHDYSWPFSADVSPAKQWLVGGGGGWGCDGPEQGFAVGIINKDENGKYSIEMHSELVDPSTCCYHQRYHLSEEEESQTWDLKAFEAALKTGDFKQTCGGAECEARTDTLKKLRKEERLAGATTTETPVAKELADDADRESLGNFEPSKYYLETIESIKQIKAVRKAAALSAQKVAVQ